MLANGQTGKYHSEARHCLRQSRCADSIKAENKALQDIDLTLPEMLTLLSAFCEAGDPNSDGLPKWTPYDQATEPYLDFGDTRPR